MKELIPTILENIQRKHLPYFGKGNNLSFSRKNCFKNFKIFIFNKVGGFPTVTQFIFHSMYGVPVDTRSNSIYLRHLYYLENITWTVRSMSRNSHPDLFLAKVVLKICSKFTGEHSCQSVISIKLLCNFTEITLWHGCSSVNLMHIFRTPFLKVHLWVAASVCLEEQCNIQNTVKKLGWDFQTLTFSAKFSILMFD